MKDESQKNKNEMEKKAAHWKDSTFESKTKDLDNKLVTYI